MPAPPPHSVIKAAGVTPFRGLRYNRDMVGDLSAVVSPPYDIISPEEQKHYNGKHPDNAIHLDFGLSEPGDTEGNNRYTRAAAMLKEWVEEGILRAEPRPAIYCLREEYDAGGGVTEVRHGFVAALRLVDFSEGIVLPHEETASGPKADRLKLMQATEANLSSIFCIYQDADEGVASALEPALARDADASLTDEAGTRHSLWVVDDEQTCNVINQLFQEKRLYIADGHHRYETALAYRDARRAEDGPGPEQPYDYLMVYLSSMDEAGRSIFPIHRFVSGLPEGTLATVESGLSKIFELADVQGESARERQQSMLTMMAEQGKDHNSFGMYNAATDTYKVLTARKPRPVIDAGDIGRSAAWRSLDVAVLDQVILADILGVADRSNGGLGGNGNNGGSGGPKVRFIERTDAALAEINSLTTGGSDSSSKATGELKASGFQLAFFVNPTSIEEIKAVSEAGEKMPQKSTYFYPKPLTGLVFRSLKL